MRRIYWCFAAIGSMAIMGTVAACSSDDSSTGGTDAGGTDGGGSDVVVPKDSGGGDTGTKDSGPCSTCGELLNGTGAISNACPGTLNKAFAVIGCACLTSPTGAGQGKCDVDSGTTSADGGPGACGTFCASPTTQLPDETCIGCGEAQCGVELGACINDGKDGGTTGDGGDGG